MDTNTMYALSQKLIVNYGYFPYTQFKVKGGDIIPIQDVTPEQAKDGLTYSIVKSATRSADIFLSAYTNQNFGDNQVQGLYVELVRRYPHFAPGGTIYFIDENFSHLNGEIEYDIAEELLEVIGDFTVKHPWLKEYTGFKFGMVCPLSVMSDEHILGALFERLHNIMRREDDAELLVETFNHDFLRQDDAVLDSWLILIGV